MKSVVTLALFLFILQDLASANCRYSINTKEERVSGRIEASAKCGHDSYCFNVVVCDNKSAESALCKAKIVSGYKACPTADECLDESRKMAINLSYEKTNTSLEVPENPRTQAPASGGAR